MKFAQPFATPSVNYIRRIGLLCSFALLSVPVAQAQATITSVNVLSQNNAAGATKLLIVEVVGTGLLPIPAAPPTMLIVPGVLGAPTPVNAPSDTLISAQFTVPKDYQLSQVVLSYSTGGSVSKDVTVTCADSDVRKHFDFVPEHQVSEKYGNGVSKNFYVVQISIVNKCAQGIVVPLAGITIGLKDQNPYVPYSLEHVTAVYTNDRTLTGTRAIFFNSFAAATTLGGAVAKFFGPGVAQGVAIFGGPFTQAAQAIFKDVSAQQLQNLASQSFQSSEQVGPDGGSVNKFIFIPKVWFKEKDKTRAKAEKASMEEAFAPPLGDKVTANLTWSVTSAPTTGPIAH